MTNANVNLADTLAANRIQWYKLTDLEIEAVATDAGAHGDSDLARKAFAALARRKRSR